MAEVVFVNIGITGKISLELLVAILLFCKNEVQRQELELWESITDTKTLDPATSLCRCSFELFTYVRKKIIFFAKASLMLVSFDYNPKSLELYRIL